MRTTGKLSEADREEFYNLWYNRARQAGYKGSILQWKDQRLRAQTDLFWLAKELLGYDLVDSYVCPEHKTEMDAESVPCKICGIPLAPCPGLSPGISIHREMCNFFVQKNPNRSIFNQDTQKDRLMLVSRGSFKSSIDEADCVQWIIGFPNIRIFLFTAEEGLGTIFVKHVKSFFGVTESPQSTKENPKYIYSEFQLLFPEHCRPASKREAEDYFVTPARTATNLRDPTLLALSIGASTAGRHCDVGKFDDCVSDGNSGARANPDTRETIRAQIFERRPVVALSGYRDYIGTIYDFADAYAYIENNIEDIKVLKRPSYTVKETSRHKKEEDLIEGDLNLLFPYDAQGREQLSYRNLMKERRADPALFHCQYQLNPLANRVVNFTEQLLRSHIVKPEGFPQTYRCFSAWDFAYSDGKSRDYSVGTVGWFDDIGRRFIVDVIRGRFSKPELAKRVAQQAARWRVEKIGIEDSGGVSFSELAIRRELMLVNYHECPLEYFKVDTSKNAKESRAENLETLLINDQLWFSSEIRQLNEVIKEFREFRPSPRRKDDVIDSIGHLMRYAPETIKQPETEQARQQKAYEIMLDKQLHELVYEIQQRDPEPEPPPIYHDGYPILCIGCAMPISSCFCAR